MVLDMVISSLEWGGDRGYCAVTLDHAYAVQSPVDSQVPLSRFPARGQLAGWDTRQDNNAHFPAFGSWQARSSSSLEMWAKTTPFTLSTRGQMSSTIPKGQKKVAYPSGIDL